MNYNKKYFESVNYTNYKDRFEKYYKLASELNDFFSEKIKIINKNDKILDYGCAFGFLIQSFKKLGYKKIYGFDISEYAKKICKSKKIKLLSDLNNLDFDLIICLDVLEHMKDDDIKKLFTSNKFNKVLLRIPCAIEKEPDKFFLEVSRRDKTHINCKTKKGWINFFKSLGYKNIFMLNLNNIYDSDGVFCAIIF